MGRITQEASNLGSGEVGLWRKLVRKMVEIRWQEALVSALRVRQKKNGCPKFNQYIASSRPTRATQRKPVGGEEGKWKGSFS